MTDVASDGLCRIVSVTGITPPQSGCIGEIRTSLSEVFGFFAVAVMHQAEAARVAHDRVLLDVRRSKLGHRYVKTITRLDTSRDPTPCLKCGTLSRKVAAHDHRRPGDPSAFVPEHYRCPSCHLLMFLEPVTRSYA